MKSQQVRKIKETEREITEVKEFIEKVKRDEVPIFRLPEVVIAECEGRIRALYWVMGG